MKLEPVASVHVSHFRQSPAMRNIEWEEISTIPEGSHKLCIVPSGYVLAPVEPKDEDLFHAWVTVANGTIDDLDRFLVAYKAMTAAGEQ